MLNLRTHLGLATALVLAAGPAFAGEGWHFGIGLSHASGFADVKDYYEREYHATSITVSPVGAVFMPSYEWNNGLRVGGDLGPILAVMGDVSFVDVPVGLSVGYAFRPAQEVSPYVRGGIRYQIASGDQVNGSSPGAFAAAGIDFAQRKRFHWGLEAAVDTSTVTFKGTRTEEIKPNRFLVNVHFTF
jgi:hypothetical protein